MKRLSIVKSVKSSFETVFLSLLNYTGIIILVICLLFPGRAAAQAGDKYQILILNSYHKEFDWTDGQVNAAREVLTAKLKKFELYVEYMDTKRICSDEYCELIYKTLNLKYRDVKLDAIIATDDNALQCLLKYRQDLFGAVPVIFGGINGYSEKLLAGRPLYTGVIEVLDIKPTIDLARHLHPGTNKVVVVNDSSKTGMWIRKGLEAVIPQYNDFKFEILKGEDFTTEELLAKLGSLPNDNIVLMTVWLRDKTGRYITTQKGVSSISASSAVPVYGLFGNHLGNGIIGGKLLHSRTHGHIAAEMTIRILGGEKPASIPVFTESANPFMFDFNLLKRWGIKISDLPEGSTVINMPFSIYEAYKLRIWLIGAVFAILFLLLVFLCLNIRDRKRVEEQLIESEKKYRSMMEAMSDPVYICSQDYRVEYMNPAMIRRTGRDATREFCYQALHGFDQPCPWCQSKKEYYGKYFESDIVSPKDNRSYHVSNSPIINSDDSISTLTIFRDTTELKETKNQLQQAQKMEAIGTLAGGVAHDFNNILTVIRGHAQLGMMKTAQENPLWNGLLEIEAAGDRASKLTRQLLAFSRKQVIKPEMIQINYLLKNLNKMLKRLIGEDVTLKTDLDEKVSPILADPGQMEQVIINLVVNAADAIKDQPLAAGRNISISTSEVLLDSNFILSHVDSKLGWHLILEITDNGYGIPNEVAEHIFEPFYTTKEVGKGTGLGLSTVYGIVKQNNASILVESEPGQGATFKIYWPSAREDTPKLIKTKKSVPTSGGDEVILLVEDEESTRNLARKILQHAGYTVIEAENGLDALEKAKELQGSIDLVFTDIVMPKMGGKELNEKLSMIYPHMEFLFTSGYLSDRVDRDDMIFKGERFVEKPYDVPVVLSKIRQLLDERKV